MTDQTQSRRAECTWTPDDDGFYATECGGAFVLDNGTPKDNGMRYCCYCGGRIAEAIGREGR